MAIILLIGIILCVGIGFVAFFGAPYVPTHRSQVRRAFTVLRPLTNKDVVVDLGSGDGIVLRQAIRSGAGRAIGYEIHPVLVVLSRWLARGFKGKITTHIANMWRVSPPDNTTIVYAFSVGRDVERLERLCVTWASQLGRPIDCIVYGHTLPSQRLVRTEGAHSLYRFLPLQSEQA